MSFMKFNHKTQPTSGCTTESLRWKDADYDETAGQIHFRPTFQASSTPYLWFVDVCVTTNQGEEIILERIEGGKILDCLLVTRKRCTAAMYDRMRGKFLDLVNAWASGAVEKRPNEMLKAQQDFSTAHVMFNRTKC